MTRKHDDIRWTITEALHEGGMRARAKQREKNLNTQSKGGEKRDLVTEADLASETAIIAVLNRDYPEIPIVSEEAKRDPKVLQKKGKKWVLDPTDGTTNLESGNPQWGPMLALVDEKGPLAGGIYVPFQEETVVAVRNKGCWLNGRLLHVTPAPRLHQCVINMEWGWWGDRQRDLAQLRLKNEARGTRAFLSAACGIVDVLKGHSSAYVNLHRPDQGACIWDFAAGFLALQEALPKNQRKGFACQPDGSPLDWATISMEAILGRGPAITKEIVTLLNQKQRS